MSQKVSIFVTVLVSVAVAVPTTLLLQGPPGVVVHEGGTPVDPVRLAQLEKRIEELALRDQTLRVPIDADLTPDRDASRVGMNRVASLERRVAALEKVQLDRRLRDAAVAPPAGPNPDREAQLRLARKQGRGKILDPNLSDADKVKAHGALRHVADAYTPAMVQELVRIGAGDQDPKIRADVWRFFDGRSNLPVLVPHLLHALVYDPVDKVRDEASETLGNYLKDPTVLSALRHAAEHDTSTRVRRKAIRTLRQNNLADAQRK